MHTLIGLQDEEIGWDDEVLQTDGFPVLEEFLVTRIWSQNVQWGLIAAKNVFRPRATKAAGNMLFPLRQNQFNKGMRCSFMIRSIDPCKEMHVCNILFSSHYDVTNENYRTMVLHE